jgi:hypothetical protein
MFVSTQVTLGVLDLVTSCSIAAEQLLAFPTVVILSAVGIKVKIVLAKYGNSVL